MSNSSGLLKYPGDIRGYTESSRPYFHRTAVTSNSLLGNTPEEYVVMLRLLLRHNIVFALSLIITCLLDSRDPHFSIYPPSDSSLYCGSSLSTLPDDSQTFPLSPAPEPELGGRGSSSSSKDAVPLHNGWHLLTERDGWRPCYSFQIFELTHFFLPTPLPSTQNDPISRCTLEISPSCTSFWDIRTTTHISERRRQHARFLDYIALG